MSQVRDNRSAAYDSAIQKQASQSNTTGFGKIGSLGEVEILPVSSSDQLADILTKPLSPAVFERIGW